MDANGKVEVKMLLQAVVCVCVCVCVIQLVVSSAINLWEGNVSDITKCKLMKLSKENVFQTCFKKFVSMPDVWTAVMAVVFILCGGD